MSLPMRSVPEETAAACVHCGARPVLDYTSCRAMFEAVLEREYSLVAYCPVHLLTVDAYALSHAAEHGPRSSAYHLVSLCRQIERGATSAIGTKRPRNVAPAFERLYRTLPQLTPPSDFGPITIADVVQARDGRQHRARVEEWAKSVYQAWHPYHEWARSMADRFEALTTATL